MIGITLGNQLAYATGDPSVEYSISAVNENGVINSVNRLNSDGTTTHISEGFGDWQTFQDWLDAGNTPNPPNNSVRLSVFASAEGIALTTSLTWHRAMISSSLATRATTSLKIVVCCSLMEMAAASICLPVKQS